MSIKASVNSWLVREKQLRGRLSDLTNLKQSLTSRTVYRDREQVVEPTYDIKKVDAMVVSLQNALFLIDNGIKESNAKTSLELDIDVDILMKPIE